MADLLINGRPYYGDKISINNNKVIIDGVNVTPEDTLQVSIIVEGDIKSIDGATDVKVLGNVGSVRTQSGDVEVGGNIEGSINTMSGDVKADGNIEGPTSTMSGDIISRI